MNNGMKIYRSIMINILFILVFILFYGSAHGRARYEVAPAGVYKPNMANVEYPFVTIGVHKVGKIALTVSNQGHFGKGFLPGLMDPLDGGEAPSCKYPFPGVQSYLFAGSFWIGAVVGRDTLVSVGADGWHDIKELWPELFPRGDIIYRSISGDDAENAISEQDYTAMYTDTLDNTRTINIDSYDDRPHQPLGIEVTQSSYGWSYSYAEDFVLFDYRIKNIGQHELKQVYMGFYVDADVNTSDQEGYDDDICGFQQAIPSQQGCGFIDTINIAWIADNDGKQSQSYPCPYSDASSLTAVTGMRVVRTPSDTLEYAFNWWISNSAAVNDFGPRRIGTLDDPFRDFGGFLGTPEGDKNKYYVMQHAEFDYDQLFSAIDFSDEGWLPPGPDADNFADGFDTRYLLSFGPFDISPGEVLPVSFAYIAGEHFHHDCAAFEEIFDVNDPYPYHNQLDFTDFGNNSMWASWIYDNPGYDTDGDGYFGKSRICAYDSIRVIDTLDETTWVYLDADTLWYEGDGVPDFRGASPPPSPQLWQINQDGDTLRARLYPQIKEHNSGEIRVRWNGLKSETTRDVFSQEFDFEGYRVYLSETPYKTDFIMLASYDIEDYNKYVWNPRRGVWVLHDVPYFFDSLSRLYGFGDGFDPTYYNIDNPFNWMDSVFYFARQDWNFADLSDTRVIYKPYPDELPPSTLNIDSARTYFSNELTEDGFFKYFEYEYIVKNLLPSRLYYISVTAFDYGSPGHDLSSLETAVTSNYVAEYAQPDNQTIEDQKLKVIVYPNPYRIDGNYKNSEHPFEGIDYLDSTLHGTIIPQTGFIDDLTRSIHFLNLPPKCTIRIFSIDGDLIRKIEHNYPPNSPRSMHERWDVISRNTQPVVSGIYYWTMESASGTQIGKLAIIK